MSRWVRMHGWCCSTLCVYLFSWTRIHFDNHQYRMCRYRRIMRSLFTWVRMCGCYCSTLCVYLFSWIRIHYDSQQHRM